tara:strand:- start:819 stop:1586 length:768 start_codon:yes stop_codon:yes gene_type:complete
MTHSLDLKLNPAADPSRWSTAYARDKLVQIPDIFEADVAEEIESVLRNNLQWRLVFPEPDTSAPGGERVVQLTQDDVAAMGRDVMAQRLRGVMDRARDNVGYLYNAYPMIEAYTGGWDAGHPIHLITEFLNSAEFLEFGRAVIGVDAITKADAQATYYARGNFLTRHVDEGHDNERRAAYTLGLTRRWEPDWGGLLMLLDGDKDIERAFLPRFNVLSIFDGRRIHSVSTVSPFAGDGRFQITGWLRDDPIPGRNS